MTAEQAHELDVEIRLKADCAVCKNKECPLSGLKFTAITEEAGRTQGNDYYWVK